MAALMPNIDNPCYQRYDSRMEDHGLVNVSLTPELEQFVQAKVESGRYNSASEVVREALRLLENHEQLCAAQLADFNQELSRRLVLLDRGETADPLEARRQLRKKSETRRKQRA